MTIGHLPSGYVAAFFTHKMFGLKLKVNELRKFIFFWMFGAVFPDVDTLPFLMDGAGLSVHRKFITHTPFLYLLISLVIFCYVQLIDKNKRKSLLIFWSAFAGGVLLHFSADSIFYGVRWLYPLSDVYFGFFPEARVSFSNFSELIVRYLMSVFFLPDLVFCLLALMIFFGKKFGLSKKI